MKFKYKKFGKILRPVIPIEVATRESCVRYSVLVDSGADLCIFHSDIGTALGLNVESGIPREVSGITGSPEKYYLHKVSISIGGWDHEVEVGFFPRMPDYSYGVVGQYGFFDKFVVKFDLLKEEIELKLQI
ncbi:MAG: Uncharacterized protein G01um10145_202 [Microgenomates group bacterium Gr01-1014_5]|nr:MAG: Uncharacterized protein G01um10145_202 [Microgenomates group bacterium Gr01-1014_5]